MNENKEIEKFDPSTLMDGVKSRIKATFVSLIPDAQWEQMCNVEMDKFFKGTPELDYSNRPTGKMKSSEFETIVTELMKEKCKQYLTALLANPKYSIENTYNHNNQNIGGGKQLSEHLDTMIRNEMPNMMQAMFGSIMASAMQQFFSNAQHAIQNYR